MIGEYVLVIGGVLACWFFTVAVETNKFKYYIYSGILLLFLGIMLFLNFIYVDVEIFECNNPKIHSKLVYHRDVPYYLVDNSKNIYLIYKDDIIESDENKFIVIVKKPKINFLPLDRDRYETLKLYMK